MKTIRSSWSVFAILLVAQAIAFAAPAAAVVLGGGDVGWKGWTTEGPAWGPLDMPRAGNPAAAKPHMESLAGGETAVGSLRSPDFVVTGDVLRFWVNGWDGKKSGERANGYFLRSADDGKTLRATAPPCHDGFTPQSWLIDDLRGRKVYFEAVDANRNPSFAWLGLASVEEIRMAIPADLSPYRALPLEGGNGTWAIMRRDGARRPATPYLSSLGGGERGTGSITSPEFAIGGLILRLVARGWDGDKGQRHSSRFELVLAGSGEVLRSSPPPMSDAPTPIEWDVTEFIGKRVMLRLVDGNSDGSYAWIGLDKINAGLGFKMDFAKTPSLEGWTVDLPAPTIVERGGIPFQAGSWSPVPENGAFERPMGFRAKRIFLLGMTNSLDQGVPCWTNPRDYSSRFFLGDQLGRIRLEYADGKRQVFPLILGESLWWGQRFFENPEPFTTDPKALSALKDSLRLYPAAPVAGGGYVAAITPLPGKISKIVIEDSPEKTGAPVVVAMTVEPVPGEEIPAGVKLPHDRPSEELLAFVRAKSLRPAGTDEAAAAKKLEPLRRALYSHDGMITGHVAPDPPKGYHGPTVRFAGTTGAEILANVFYYNVYDIQNKVDAAGMYHTSTKNAPSYGGYEGFGTFRRNVGSYYGHSWSRDLGRSLQEITELGCTDEALRCADYCLRSAKLYEERSADLKVNGSALPRHWSRIINLPGSDNGCFENDGHGMISLFLYKLWQRLPNRETWLRARWEDIRGAGDWILWQFDHPEISGATDLLLTDSECSGGIGRSVYADFACMEALRGLAEMADSIGEKQSADRWRERAGRMQKAIAAGYLIPDAKYGKTWTLASSGWPHQSTVLGPTIFVADRRGFAPEDDDPALRAGNLATYKRIIDTYRPLGFYGCAMGYSQGFITEAGLLLDRMSEATKMVEWAAKATYSPRCQPYIVPEGCEIDPTGKYWFRTGDLGNGVQQGEIVKVVRLVIGVDDTQPARPRLFPRMPFNWTEMAIDKYPILVERNGKRENALLRYQLQRTKTGMSLRVAADRNLGPLPIRLGPFANQPKAARVLTNGKPTSASIEHSGDSWWLRFTGTVGTAESVVRATTK